MLKIGSFNEVQELVAGIKATNEDRYFKMGDDVTPLLNPNHYTNYGLQSAGNRLGFPARFLMKHAGLGHEETCSQIIGNCISDFFKKNDQKAQLLVRDFAGKHCGILTEHYSIFDDDTICDILSGNDYLMDAESVWYSCTAERFHARFVSKKKWFMTHEKSPLSIAVFVDNSMVGQSSFRIRFGMYRHACTNGLIFGLNDFVIVREFHKGKKDYQQIVANALADIGDYENIMFEIVEDAIQKESSIYGMKVEQAALYLSKKLNISSKKANSIVESYKTTYGGHSKWDLVNAITDVAHDASVQERIMLEERALMVA